MACPDKFRGTASAAEVAAAIEAGVRVHVGDAAEVMCLPTADGGEGTLEALGGPNRTSLVTGPLRERIEAAWRLDGEVAIVEMARASGLLLAGGAEGNDPLAATTAGTGELIAEAVAGGARRVIVGVGGSATTDGGLGALDAMAPLARLAGVSVVVACDVRTGFCDAARIFGPQKGATGPQVKLLARRLERLVDLYIERYGVDVSEMARAGAAGGLAGGLAAGLRAELAEGFEVVATEVGLAEAIEEADLVITGEGRLDAGSFDGKVVGGVLALATEAGVPAGVIAGAREPGIDLAAGLRTSDQAPVSDLVVLTEQYGTERSMSDTLSAVSEAAAGLTAGFCSGGGVDG
ncbi:glycerate kinase [Candidatus Poriferisodalis sp.]|uniref:glycerate kinase family protein n=1 Tax=Candidatus Poriferisodalis sp. TaxID=3101277 RepID=UPI003B0142B0